MTRTPPRSTSQIIGAVSACTEAVCSALRRPHNVASWEDPQRSVLSITVIQMYADRQHPLKNRHWRLHIHHAGLGRPRSITIRNHAGVYTNREILMPRHEPVGIASFVEQRSFNGNRLESRRIRVDRDLRANDARNQLGSWRRVTRGLGRRMGS